MPIGAIELVSVSEYARLRGCSEGAVRKAVLHRRISMQDGGIDPVAADAQWAKNTRPRAANKTANGGSQAIPENAATSSPKASDGYWASKSRREAAEAAMAELKLAEMRGDLVRVDDIRSALSRRVAGVREALLQLPARVVPVLAANPDARAMNKVLRVELIRVLSHFSEGESLTRDGPPLSDPPCLNGDPPCNP